MRRIPRGPAEVPVLAIFPEGFTSMKPLRFATTTIPLMAACLLSLAPTCRAGFLDLNSLTTGENGSFTGTIDGVAVTGTIAASNTAFVLNAPGTTFRDSTINNSSPQYSYSSVYSPTIPLTDRVGYAFFGNPQSITATIVINFAAPLVNPIFHVANLDDMSYDFAGTAGLTGLQVLNGNGGADGDGLLVAGTIISDANPATIIGVDPTVPPPTSGPRSAYGSLALLGTLQSLTITVTNPNVTGGGDGGSFTFSTMAVPEPSSMILAALGLAPILVRSRRRHGR